MTKVNLAKGGRKVGVWGRLVARVRADQAKCGPLWDAVMDMHFEEAQRVLGADPVGFGFALEERKTA